MWSRLTALRATKWYDLLAATPLICFYLYAADRQFEVVWREAALAKLIVQTDVRALSLVLVTRIAANLATLWFMLTVVALLAVRRAAIARLPGLYPRAIGFFGTFWD